MSINSNFIDPSWNETEAGQARTINQDAPVDLELDTAMMSTVDEKKFRDKNGRNKTFYEEKSPFMQDDHYMRAEQLKEIREIGERVESGGKPDKCFMHLAYFARDLENFRNLMIANDFPRLIFNILYILSIFPILLLNVLRI